MKEMKYMALTAAALGKQPYVLIPVFYGTSRNIVRSNSDEVVYGSNRAELSYGKTVVSIPKKHKVGEIERPKWWWLEFKKVPEKHFKVEMIFPLSEQSFFRDLREKIHSSSEKKAFVYIHGFGTSFEDSAFRTAQIAYDLKFDGVPIMYTWASQGRLLKDGLPIAYTTDEQNIEISGQHLITFLNEILQYSDLNTIHLIAHSMGNRALISALKELVKEKDLSKPLFNEVIITAPDIDAEVFKRDIVTAVKACERVTLYTSLRDKALILSQEVHGYPRAGNDIAVFPSVDTIDASEIKLSFLGHSYFAENRIVINDVFSIINNKLPPSKRNLEPREKNGKRYWYLRP